MKTATEPLTPLEQQVIEHKATEVPVVNAFSPKLCCSVPINGGSNAPPIAKEQMIPEARLVCSPKSSDAKLKILPHIMELKKPQSNIKMTDSSPPISSDTAKRVIATVQQ